MNNRITRTTVAAAAVAAGLTVLTACGTTSAGGTMPGMDMNSPVGSMPSHPTMNTMSSGTQMGTMPMAHGNGLSASEDGYTLVLTSEPRPGTPTPVTFMITKDGKPVTDFDVEQTKRLHFYLIREDLTGFQHLHPTMAADGTWSVDPAAMQPGTYRIYTQFDPKGAAEPYVLSVPVKAGNGSSQPLPAASNSTTVDGYQVTLDGTLVRGGRVKVSFAKDGKPVTDLQPYLETYAHVTGFREGDMAFTHLHPSDTVTTKGGGPDLTFVIEAPEPGTYRLFIQFEAGGSLHTAAVTTAIN